MKTHLHSFFLRLLSLVFLVGLVASNQDAMAAKPVGLKITEKYNFPLIAIRTDSLGDFGIRLEIMDTSAGYWQRPNQTKAKRAEGEEVTLDLENTFSDNSVVNTKVTAKIEGNLVKVRGEWPTESTIQGFIRMDLWFSRKVAEDLTIYADGEVLTTNMDKGTEGINEVDSVEVYKTSTGEFLFRVTGSSLLKRITFSPDNPDEGLRLELYTSRNPFTTSISEVTEMEYTVSFDK
jgi:hypothetical protein